MVFEPISNVIYSLKINGIFLKIIIFQYRILLYLSSFE